MLAAFFVLGLAPLSHAGSDSRTYVGASPGLVGVTTSAPSLVVPGSEFGGAHFTANGLAPLTVTAADASGLSILVQVCQDTNGDGLCNSDPTVGDVEPAASGCGSADLSTSLVPFDPAMDTIVFVYGSDLPSTDCTGLATTGTITINYG